MTARLNRWLLALLIIVGLPYYWLLIDDRPGVVEPHPISIRQLRDLSRDLPGHAPTAITYYNIASRSVPRIVVAAGQGVILFDFTIRAFRIAIPNQKPIMIDSGMSAAAAQNAGLEHYDAASQARVNKELKNAQLVLTLSDNDSHSGGLKLAGLELPARDVPKGTKCPGPRAIAAGVVEIPVCDNVLASRMVYVRLDDHREFLLTGDIAPTKENVTSLSGPSRLMNSYFEAQDRTALHGWLITIARLSREAPELIIIPGHAPLSTEDMLSGLLSRRKP